MTEINLINKGDTSLLRKRKTVKIFQTSSVAGLLIIAGLSILVFFLKLSSPLSSLRAQEADLVTQISKYSDTIVELQLMSQKISAISAITNGRTDYSKAVAVVTGATIPGASLGLSEISNKEVSINSSIISKTGVDLNASSKSLLSVNSFLDDLTQLAGKKIFKKVILNNLNAQPGLYTFSVSINF